MPDPVVIEPAVVPKVEPVVEPAVEPKAEPVVVAKVEPVVPVVEPAPKKDWKDSRIAELTAKLNQERAKKVEPPKAEGESQAEFDARVEVRAQALAEEKSSVSAWNRQCNEVALKGREQYTDFDTRLDGIKQAVDANDPREVQQYNTLLAAAIETGRASELLHELGADVGEARRLMALSPMKLAIELTQRAAKLEAIPDPSAAPKPIKPVGSGGVHYEGIKPDDPNRGTKLPIGEWMKQREAQARERGLQ